MKVSIRKHIEVTTFEAESAEIMDGYFVAYGATNQHEQYMELAINFGGQCYLDDILWVDIPMKYIVCIDNRNEDRE